MCQTKYLKLPIDESVIVPLTDGMSIGGFSQDGRYFRGCIMMLKLNGFDLLNMYSDLLEYSFRDNCSRLFTSHASSAAMVIPPMGNIRFDLSSGSVKGFTHVTPFKFKLRSSSSSASVFHLTENFGVTDSSKHILLNINDGVLTLIECLQGRLSAYLKSKAPVDDGLWHSVSMVITASGLWLTVGKEALQWSSNEGPGFQRNFTQHRRLEIVFGTSKESHTLACSKENLTPTRSSLMCIQEVYWGESELNFLNAISSSMVTIDCPPCLDRSRSSSCMSWVKTTATDVSTESPNKQLLNVDEGGQVCLDLLHFKSVIDAFPVGENLLCTMFNSPEHGKVYKLHDGGIKIPVFQFTTKDLLYHRIFYAHDGSETQQDEMEFEIESEESYKAFVRNVPHVFILINVNSLNDAPKVLLPSGGTLHLLQHSSLKITKDAFNIYDPDSEPDNIQIYVQQQISRSVYIEHEKFPGEPISNFTWQNVLRKEISIVHVSGWSANMTLHVVDNYGQGSLVEISVQIHRARIKRLRKAALELPKRSSALVTEKHLSYSIPSAEGKESEVMYGVIRPPSKGSFELQISDTEWTTAEEFTQADIQSRRVRYVSTADGEYNNDTATLKISSQALDVASEGELLIKLVPKTVAIFKSIPFTMIAQRKAALQRKHLLAWTFPNPILPEDITYQIVRAPLYGFLTKTIARSPEQRVRRLGVHSKFTQADIDRYRLTYELRHGHYSIIYDHFQFTLTALDSVTTPCRFFIAYIPESEHLMVVNRTVIVEEGSSKMLSNHTLSTKMNRFDNFQYKVLSGAKRGRVVFKRRNGPMGSTPEATTFTTKDINEGLVWYEHDGSESRQDKVYIAVSPLIQSNVVEDRIKLTFWLHIRILPNGKNPPKRMHSIDHVCFVTKTEEKILTADDLSYVDKDGDNDSRFLLYHFPEKMKEGSFYTTKLPGISIHVFSQHDVNSKHITYLHTADAMLYKIPFYVTDGKHVVEDRLIVNVSEPFFTVYAADPLEMKCSQLMPIRLGQFAITTNMNYEHSDIIFTTSSQSEGGQIMIDMDGQTPSPIDQFTLEDLANGHVYYKCSRKADYPHWIPLLISFDRYSVPVSLHIKPKVGSTESDKTISVMENGVTRLSAESVRFESYLTKNPNCSAHFKVVSRPENGSLALGRYAKFQTADIIGMDRFHVDSFTWHDIEYERLHYVHRMGAGNMDTIVFNVSSPCSAFSSSLLTLNISVRPSVSLKVTELIVSPLQRVLLTPDNIQIESDFHGLESDRAVAVLMQPSYGRLVIEKQGKYDFQINHFHEGDLKFGNVWYIHENGTSDHDEFSVAALLRNYTMHSAPATVSVQIRRLNRNGPTIARKETIIFNQGQDWNWITKKNLEVTDGDTPDNQIVISVLETYNGFVTFMHNPAVKLANFTQADINERKVIFAIDDHLSRVETSLTGFTFSVTDSKHSLMPDWLGVLRGNSKNAIEWSQTLLVAPGSITPLISSHLYTSLTGIAPRNCVYSIIDQPAYGHILLRKRKTTMFSQLDIDNGFVSYNQSQPVNKWLQKDFFSYIVSLSNVYSNVSTFTDRKRFRISICFAFLKEKEKENVLRIRPVKVPFRGKANVTNANFDIATIRSMVDDELLLEWTEMPRNGWLEVKAQREASNISPAIITAIRDAGDLLAVYHHSSLALTDEITINVFAKDKYRVVRRNVLKVTLKFHISLLETKSSKRDKILNIGSIRVVQGQRRLMSKKDVVHNGMQARSKNLSYRVVQLPDSITLIRNTSEEHRTVDSFTEEDIASKTITLISSGKLENGTLLLSTTDPLTKDIQLYQFQVIVEPLTLEMLQSSIIYYPQTDRQVVIASEHLMAESNGPPQQIIYEVSQRPENGSLQWSNGTLLKQFTQTDIANGHIVYKPTNMHAYKDQFQLKVFNQFKTIDNQTVSIWVLPAVDQKDLVVVSGDRVIITSDALRLHDDLLGRSAVFRITKRPKYGLLTRVASSEDLYTDGLDSFTAAELRDKQIQYVSTVNEDVKKVELDEFKFELTADRLQPAIGQVSILIIPRPEDIENSVSFAEDVGGDLIDSPVTFTELGSAFWVPNINVSHDVVGMIFILTSVSSVFVILIRKIRVCGKKRRILKSTEYRMKVTREDSACEVESVQNAHPHGQSSAWKAKSTTARNRVLKHAMSLDGELDDGPRHLARVNCHMHGVNDGFGLSKFATYEPNRSRNVTLPREFSYDIGELSSPSPVHDENIMQDSSAEVESNITKLHESQYWV
ncbi:laminin G domain protein [Trichuris suis]|nr:laminin G domain protein [Trichuris suis]